MERRTKIIWAVVCVVIIAVLLALYFWALRQRPAAPAVPVANQPANQAGLPVNGGLQVAPDVNQPVNSAPIAPTAPDSAPALRRLAASFAERWGSFSSLGDSSNQTDLKPQMTAAMGVRVDAEVAARRPTDQYRGTTTRALAVTVDSLDEAGGVAELTVRAQRAESVGDAVTPSVRYEDLRLDFKIEDGTWKVDAAAWAPATQ